jgi:small GTP-binding protein
MVRAEKSLPAFSCTIAMVGLYGVGKTSLVRRYVDGGFERDYRPTLGVQVSKKIVESDQGQVDFILWDLEGKDEREQLQDAYLGRLQAYILVADVSRAVSLERAIALQQQIERLHPTAPFVLALNKSDLPEWQIGESHLAKLDPAWTIVQTSARTGDGVEKIFSILANRLIDKLRSHAADNVDEHVPRKEAPQSVLKQFLSRPQEIVILNPQPMQIRAGEREARVSMALLGEANPPTNKSECSIQCRCSSRKDLRCRIISRADLPGSIDVIIEIPEALPSGDRLSFEFVVGGDEWEEIKPFKLTIH